MDWTKLKTLDYYLTQADNLDVGIYKKGQLLRAIRRLHAQGIEPNVLELAKNESQESLKYIGREGGKKRLA